MCCPRKGCPSQSCCPNATNNDVNAKKTDIIFAKCIYVHLNMAPPRHLVQAPLCPSTTPGATVIFLHPTFFSWFSCCSPAFPGFQVLHAAQTFSHNTEMSQNASFELGDVVCRYTCVATLPACQRLKGEKWFQRIGVAFPSTTVSQHHLLD